MIKKYILKNKIKIIPSSDFLDRVTWIRIVKKKVGKNVGIFSKGEFWDRVTKIQMLKKKRSENSSSHQDESSSQGLSLNGSQHGNCSTEYDTPAGT